MKKISIVLLFMVVAVTIGFGQKNVRQTASNYLKDGKLDKALEAINQCIQDPSTATDPKAWFIRGNIYLEIANTQNPEYKALDPNALEKSLDSYKKATEYDVKKEYQEDIYAKVNWQRNNYFNTAVDDYNKKLYKEAMIAFENGAKALQSINMPDTISLFYAAACAGVANERDKAKEYYVELLKQKAKSTTIYVSLADIYRQEKDTANALKVIRAGQKLYPNDLKLFLTETNIYLSAGDTKKALSNLKLATQKDSANATVFFALGTIYDNLSNDTVIPLKDREEYFGEAIKAYSKAVALNNNYFEPNYNIGALYVNKAALIYDEANKLPLDAEKEFARLNGEANSFLEKAAPFLERASEIQPSDMNTLNSLKQIYTRTKNTEKLKSTNEKIAGQKK